MLNNINFSHLELSTLKVERIIDDLKNALIAQLTDTAQNLNTLIIAAEYFNINHVKWLSQIGIDKISLIIPAKRANYLFSTNNFQHTIAISLGSDDLDQIVLLTNSQAPLNTNFQYNICSSEDKYQAALQLMKIAELLPAAIVIEIKSTDQESIKIWANDNIINTINVADIQYYAEHHAVLLQKICSASLKLKYAEEAEIVAFRSITGGKEQYALMIGALSDTDIPVVRIHSSCYTGDLLASLMCDCGDQLNTAIEHMASDKKNAGIIIYLMQEGRGIGFINKLRTYGLQSNGFDTVEANEAWGFDDDERLFMYACQILKLLQVNKVRLLSNNPRKALSLEAGGIEVAEILPHKTKANKHNDFYLKVKAEKLGHEL